ncbi:MAG: aminotransferase class I/II-fold pyridoxal phosphate-dependent enzyme [Bdellovibrionaceae bacterium]|nr:aminotransferase class I/II-fold pyridoxal phosphate-dependent enzyme [Bdellovibrio sp.]
MKKSKSKSKSTPSKQQITAPSIKTFNIHGSASTKAWEFSHHLVPPMTASTTFRLHSLQRGADGFQIFADPQNNNDPIWIYDRLEEPSSKMLEEQLAKMENGEVAVSFSTGMGAISASFLAFLKSGDQVLSHKTLYGCTYSLITNWLPRYGITYTLLNVNEISAQDLKNKKVKIVYFESVANPSLEIIDIDRIAALIAKENKTRKSDDQIKMIVDNTFATPWGLRPLDHGADIVIQSLTKNIAGFGTEMGGALITSRKFLTPVLMIRKDIGATMHPHSAWNIMVYGISSQILRFEAQQKNALIIGQYLEKNNLVESVFYPGLKSFPQFELAKKLLRTPKGEFAPGTMLTFTLKGSAATTEKFINYIAKNGYTITLAVSLGLIKTLIEVPGMMTHSAVPKDKQVDSGIPEKLIRMSIGIEEPNDIIGDLEQAFNVIKKLKNNN